jgi:anaerobic selenocysteine-containing dehydrogenase
VPKYIQEWDNPFPSCRCEEGRVGGALPPYRDPTKQPPDKWDVLTHKEVASGEEQERPRNDIYTLQAIGHHTLARVHSTHANNDWLQEAFPQRIFINPIDAQARDIHDGDLVRVWNGLGEMVIQARVTPRIMPGVVDIPQGAWWKPDANGVDHGGCINVLTSHRWTPLAFGSAQQTIMVEVERYGLSVEREKPKRSTFNAKRGSK